MLDEAIKGRRHRHHLCPFVLQALCQGAGLELGVGVFLPELQAPDLKPLVELMQGFEGRRVIPQAMPCILNRLLHLPLLPPGGGIAKFGLEQVVADHGVETLVYLPLLPPTDLIDSGLHVVVDAPFRDPAKRVEGVVVRIEQHLVGLGQVGLHEEGATVAELEVGNLQLGADAIDPDPVLAPVELERLTGGKLLGDIGLFTGGARSLLLFLAPLAGEGGHPVVGAGVAQDHQITV